MKFLTHFSLPGFYFIRRTSVKRRACSVKRQLSASLMIMMLIVSPVWAGSYSMDTGFYTPPASQDLLPLVKGENVRNVILLIGDGMSLPQVTLAQFANPGPDGRLYMQRMPVTGLANTVAADELITDSAAGVTAIASGRKTNNGIINELPDGTQTPNIAELAHKNGMATGIVVTCGVTHATPAGFASRVWRRSHEDSIAVDISTSGLDVVLGGGLEYFLPKSDSRSKRTDGMNLLQAMKKSGYAFVDTRAGLEAASGEKLLGLFADGPLTTTDTTQPSLEEMTRKAIELLSTNGKGFFLMVEGSQIDWEAHANEEEGIVRETLLFDQAVGVALDYAEKDGHTLVIVTADHETGGLTIPEGTRDGSWMRVAFSTGHHTPLPVPVFAYGPGAVRFTGFYQNTELPRKMADLLGIKGLLPRGVLEVIPTDKTYLERMSGR
jgi:alkaline phosphatase